MARGDFDDLPGSGRPLRLPATHDPDWWIKQRISEDDVDRDALLPPVVLLRREHDDLDGTLVELTDEAMVRAYAEDFSTRVLRDRAANPLARMLAPTLDVDRTVERWREVRASAGFGTDEADAPDGSDGPGTAADRTGRWPWRWFRRR
jgi:hypothetical protein